MKKRRLHGLKFDFDGCHVALCDKSQPPASGKEGAYLFKSVAEEEVNKSLTENQEKVLSRLKDNYKEIQREESTDQAASDASEVDVKLEKSENDNNMSNVDSGATASNEELLAQLQAAKEELREKEALIAKSKLEGLEKDLEGFGLEADLVKSVASIVSELEDEKAEAVLKSLENLHVAKSEAEIASSEGNEIAKSLSSEDKGYEGTPELTEEEADGPKELTFLEKARKYQKNLK